MALFLTRNGGMQAGGEGPLFTTTPLHTVSPDASAAQWIHEAPRPSGRGTFGANTGTEEHIRVWT
jgi:hypothetical protein